MLTLLVGAGAGTAAGTKSWLAIGGVRIGQPAEFAKIATILMLARHLGGRRRSPQTVSELLRAFSTLSWGGWIVVLTVLLIIWRPYVLEGAAIWLANVIMGVIALDLWTRLAPYQQNRLLSFLNPEIDPRATGWNIIQSKVAIGSGGLFGKGFTLGTQKRLAFLPAQHTDFVFPI